jgi:hypothetical protein
MKTTTFYAALFLTSLPLALSNPCYADDVTDAMDKALSAYKAGQSQQAITQLELATQLVRQQRATAMESVLPAPLKGWTADAPESTSVGAAMFGGGSTIKRNYAKDGQTLSIEIVSDSPMLQSVMGLLTNPMFGAASQGGKIQMINGQQAIIKKDSIMLVVDKTFLITIAGSDTLNKEMLEYAQAIDLKKLATFK